MPVLIVPFPLVVPSLSLILLAPPLDRTLIIWVKPDSRPGLPAHLPPQLCVPTTTDRARFRKEEGQELVWDREVRGLLELLECGEADQHFEHGEGGFDWRECCW